MALKRENNSVLGWFERPALAWLARNAPEWLVPDHLTAFGFCGAMLAASGFVFSSWSISWLWVSSIGLAMNWLGDSLDGNLARFRHIERPRYGFFVDHTCDMFSQVLIFLGVGISPCAHFATACWGLIVFLMAFVYTLIGTHVRERMRITYFGFGPTEIRALLIAGNLLVLCFGVVDIRGWLGPVSFPGPVSIHDFVIVIIASGGAMILAGLTAREIGALGREDPPLSVSRNTQ